MDELKEFNLIKDCQEGKLESFEELYNEYFEKIYKFIFFRTSHKETAEDITSLTFIKALEKINIFKSEYGFFSSWLYKIARNNIIDYYRKKKEVISDQYSDNKIGEEEKTVKDIEEEIDIKYGLKKAEKYIENLKPEQKEILIMRIWDQLSYKEISKIVGKSEENCKVIFSRCMKTIKEQSILICLLILLRLIK
jgi:RNA polymerase sigma factor (sigma-70 family)